MLLHTEHSLLSLLSGMEGVVQKHDFFTEMCLMEESNPGNGSKSIYNGRKLRRICLVLDCLTPNDFTNRTQNLVNLQVVICQNDSSYPHPVLWSIGHILEHEFFYLGHLGSQGSKGGKVDLRNSKQLLIVVFSTFGDQNKHFKKI